MAITATLTSTMSNSEFLSQFDKHTRFCIIPDHYNTPPLGYPDQKKFNHEVPLAEQLMQQEKNVIFLTTNWHSGLDNLDNVHYYNPFFLYINHLLKSAEIDISKIGQPYIANVIGYKERHNRILSSHWLAKNFPVNELLTNWKNNNSLDKTYNIIKNSKYSSKSHLQKNKFLRENYYEDNFDAQTPWNIWHPSYKRFITHLLPHIFRKSLVSILLDTANLEPINTLSDKSLYSMASGCLILPVGCYQIHEMLKKIGFCIFDDVFDMKHLENKDLYARTVMGFENNKSIITSKEKVKHLWNEHSREIQHNHIHACKTDSIKNFFKESIGLAKEACKFVDGSTDYELGFGVY